MNFNSGFASQQIDQFEHVSADYSGGDPTKPFLSESGKYPLDHAQTDGSSQDSKSYKTSEGPTQNQQQYPSYKGSVGVHSFQGNSAILQPPTGMIRDEGFMKGNIPQGVNLSQQARNNEENRSYGGFNSKHLDSGFPYQDNEYPQNRSSCNPPREADLMNGEPVRNPTTDGLNMNKTPMNFSGSNPVGPGASFGPNTDGFSLYIRQMQQIQSQTIVDQATETYNDNLDGKRYHQDYETEINKIKTLLEYFYKGDMDSVDGVLYSNLDCLEKFYETFQPRKDPLKLKIACIFSATGQPQEAKEQLKDIQDPDVTNPDRNNADCQRIFYLIQANDLIGEGKLREARKCLEKCWDIPQELFEDKKEDYLDFYASYMGKIYLKEKKFSEAESSFLDALELRKALENGRLISLSYHDLALLYAEKVKSLPEIDPERTKGQAKAKEYLKKASEYDSRFVEAVKNKGDDLLMGQVDYKRVNLEETTKLINSLA